jgi:hypothetical protein
MLAVNAIPERRGMRHSAHPHGDKELTSLHFLLGIFVVVILIHL